MPQIAQALEEMKSLHEKVLGRPAPPLGAPPLLPMPFGVPPIEHVLSEARHVRQLAEEVSLAPNPNAWRPLADSLVGDEEFVARVEVPGVAREDLKVHVTGHECIVRGERKPPQGTANTRPLSLERPWGGFERRFVLPAGCRAEGTRARCVDGVLEIKIPVDRAQAPAEQRIEVT